MTKDLNICMYVCMCGLTQALSSSRRRLWISEIYNGVLCSKKQERPLMSQRLVYSIVRVLEDKYLYWGYILSYRTSQKARNKWCLELRRTQAGH